MASSVVNKYLYKSKLQNLTPVVLFFLFQFKEDDFQLRTRQMYNQNCTDIENADGDISQRYGINSRSILNMSRYFHVVEGLPGDAMHDVLEGLLQYEVKEYLKYTIYEEHFLTLENLNTSIKEFDYGCPDVTNKPSLISSKTLNSGTNSLKQRGLCINCTLILRIILNKTCLAKTSHP